MWYKFGTGFNIWDLTPVRHSASENTSESMGEKEKEKSFVFPFML